MDERVIPLFDVSKFVLWVSKKRLKVLVTDDCKLQIEKRREDASNESINTDEWEDYEDDLLGSLDSNGTNFQMMRFRNLPSISTAGNAPPRIEQRSRWMKLGE